jgi:hypothetical protein
MKLTITRTTFAGGQLLTEGEDYDIKDGDARLLVALGYAKPATEKKAAKKVAAKKK